jgi:hypothetical protein
MNDKERLVQKIDDLKADIQYLISKKKTIKDKKEIVKIDTDKAQKLEQLQQFTNELKRLHAEEKLELQRQKEMKSVSNAVDSLIYHAAKKKKQNNASEKLEQAKETREKAKQEYFDYLRVEAEYLRRDPPDMPGILFLHERIINAYGVCPVIDIQGDQDIKDEVIIRETREKRRQWLLGQNDGGKLYFDFYDEVILQSEVQLLREKMARNEEKIQKFIENLLSDSQKQIFDDTITILEEYSSCNIKTKRVKERYKVLIHNLSILYAETEISIHDYLSSKYGTNIVINTYEGVDNSKMPGETLYLLQSYSSDLEDYKCTQAQIVQKIKYNMNTVKNLKNDLYLYITKQKGSLYNNKGLVKNVCQKGKYFKKWTSLTEDEKFERLDSYSEFYVEKNMVQQKILEQSMKDVTVKDLSDLLKDALKNKTLVYRDFTWNTKRGIIETVKTLRYNKDDACFFLLQNAKNKNDTAEVGPKSKRKSCVRTIITRYNEKIINEELLYFIVKLFGSDASEEDHNKDPNVSKENKEKCIERIKDKLKLKKITVIDKVLICKKYDDIYEVVMNNRAIDS